MATLLLNVMKIGIIGLPNVGKSTLFNALTMAHAEIGNYPFTTKDKNIGIVSVPDERLKRLGELLQPKIITPATIEFVDIAGLVKGASQGEGLGNRFLSHIREVDCLLHVVRGFENPDVPHVEGTLNPLRDIETIHTELALSDLESLERRIEKVSKGKDPEEWQRLVKVKERIEREGSYMEDGLHLLTAKPFLIVFNVDEGFKEDTGRFHEINEFSKRFQSKVIAVSLKIEEELAHLEPSERRELRKELGLSEGGLEPLIQRCYELLDLITFYTIKGEETRAWSAPRGTSILHAAGKIHSDMERGFIRAEVIGFEELNRVGSMVRVREEGNLRTEGRDYLVQDGDILLIKFRV